MRPWPLVAVSVITVVPALVPGMWQSSARADGANGANGGPGSDAGDVATTAEPGGAPAAPARIGYGALPGTLHVAAAEIPLPGTVELGLLSGFGYRGGLLGTDRTFDRALGDIAVSYAPLASLAIALSFDGRYDKHSAPGGKTDDGYVGDPH